jgi:hypothetical protein
LAATDTIAIAASLTVVVDPLPLGPLDIIATATLGFACGVVVIFGAYCPDNGVPPTVDPSLWTSLFSSGDTSASLDGD